MLKGRRMDGAKFRRQFSLGPYILDFYCPEFRICVELDGDGHYSADGYEHDQKRNSYLYEEHGITTLRYENKDVFKSPENICKQICEVIRAKRDKTYTAIPFQQTVPLRQGDEERSDGGGG
jgi:very-short-patch-repair endonuclease